MIIYKIFLSLFKAKLKKIKFHKSFQYYSFKIKSRNKHKYFTKCQYKLEIIDINTNNNNNNDKVIIYFKYNDELTIKQYGKFNIYVKNKEIFGIDQFILIQKIVLNDDNNKLNDENGNFINNLILYNNK